MVWSWAAQASLGPGVMENSRHVVEPLADVDPAGNQVCTGLVDVVGRELQALGRRG